MLEIEYKAVAVPLQGACEGKNQLLSLIVEPWSVTKFQMQMKQPQKSWNEPFIRVLGLIDVELWSRLSNMMPNCIGMLKDRHTRWLSLEDGL